VLVASMIRPLDQVIVRRWGAVWHQVLTLS
jgi:hypothetical protein